jgi:hypothetical protein
VGFTSIRRANVDCLVHGRPNIGRLLPFNRHAQPI